jgi:uroporphyrinogen decarboxylase
MPNRQALSGRQRVALALQHRQTDRIPIAMVCAGINPPARKALADFLAAERGLSVEAYLDPILDIVEVSPAYAGPVLPPHTDIWGVRRREVSYGSGSYDEIAHHPLAAGGGLPDLEAHRWPDPDWFDYEGLPTVIDSALGGADKCVMVGNGNIFETSWYMRGFERMFMDLALNPELANAIFERVCSFYCEHFTRMLEAADGGVDLVFTADDIGGQQGLLMSLEMWRRNIRPYHERLNRTIHQFNAKVIYHTDGSVMEAVPGLIGMGVDVLQALQFDAAGMDATTLKAVYGDRLCFEGGVSVQHTLPFGTAEQVRREVVERVHVLGRGGGYILGPSHAIQAGTPPENIVAMFDTAASTPMVSA